MRKKSLTKDQREIQIIQWFRDRVKVDNWNIASLAEIAKGIGMSPSSHLRKITDNLVADGTLVTRKFQRSGRWQGRGYRPSRQAFRTPQRTLVINFNQHGKQEKLELLL